MNSQIYKCCAVPQCRNTSIKTPSKLFVYVPHKKTMRNKWLNLARRDPTSISLNSKIYFCEDHFDLPNDMENYMEYHVMGSVSKVIMKSGCIPTKFGCQSDRRKRTCNTDRPYILKKQRKTLIEQCEKDLQERSTAKKHLEPGETSTGSSEMSESRAEYMRGYMREYRQRKCRKNLKAGEKPKKVHNKVKIDLDEHDERDDRMAPCESLCEVYVKQEPLDSALLDVVTVKQEDEDCIVEDEVDPLELDVLVKVERDDSLRSQEHNHS